MVGDDDDDDDDDGGSADTDSPFCQSDRDFLEEDSFLDQPAELKVLQSVSNPAADVEVD